MKSQVYMDLMKNLVADLEKSQRENILKAGEIIAESIMNGGIMQTFGSGHSYANAIEIAGRAGGLIPAKAIVEPAMGDYERIEGVGEAFISKSDLRKEDCLVIISNSGRNPLIIEISEKAKEVGMKIIAVTSLEVSKQLTSRHSNGKMLYDYADVVLDNRGVYGDAAIEMEGLPIKTGPTSSISGAILLNCVVVEAIEKMIAKGYVPPVYMSENIDGGPEFNIELLAKYKDRLNRV